MQPTTAAFHLAPQQKRLWNQRGESARRSAQVAVRLDGPLDPGRLSACLQRLAEAHEILRTTFSRSGRVAFQVVNDAAPVSLEAVDLRCSDAAAQTRWLDQELECDGESSGMRASLATLADERHLLAITVPSLCLDAASLRQVVAQLAGLYGGEDPAAEILQYADYSDWQNDLLQSDDADAAAGREYWSRQDSSELPPPALAFARKVEGAAFAMEEVAVPAPGKLPAAWLLAGWQTLLWRLTGQTEIAVGWLSDGRARAELSNALGLFSKALPIRTSLAQNVSFAEAAQKAEKLAAEAVAREDYYPLDRAARLPMGFSFQEKLPDPVAAGVQFTASRYRCPGEFQLELRCSPEAAALVYDPACFDRATVERMAGELAALLASATENPAAPAAALRILGESERRQVLSAFNQTAQPYDREKPIARLFEEQAARTPGRAALRCGERRYTYGELNAQANQLAHLLRARGVQANIPVGLLMERSAETILALMGILKAGGCYLPLVPDNPPARLAHQLAETGARVVLTQESLHGRVPEFAGETICLDADSGLWESQSTDNPPLRTAPEDVVYIIYTSGSTGTPKGVAVRQFNLTNYSQYICRLLELERHPEGLQFATVSTISADLGNTCIFPALISGGCVHVVDYQTAMAADRFAAYATANAIDVLKITPSHLNSLLEGGGAAVLPRQFLFSGGEAFRWGLLERIREAGRCAVINHYGPTETTVGCCTFAVERNDVSSWMPATVPIGKPIANTRVYILDGLMQPVPLGAAGELCVGGEGVALGYWGQAQQTAERFIADPFSSDAGARVYRTGDLARFLPDGNIEFLGRADHQVKIRGFRVEPAEIEAALRQHPQVREVAIVAYDDRAGERRLAAYVVSPALPPAEELRAFLLRHVPEYMVPSAFVPLAAIPLTPNGKLDRQALPAPELEHTGTAGARVAPRTPEEAALMAIWQEVLHTDEIGVTDNFFELGGHSLLAIQLISRIRNVFHVQLPLPTFLETPAIADLAVKIRECPAVESEEEEMARLLEQIEGMTEEEAQRLLAEESAGE